MNGEVLVCTGTQAYTEALHGSKGNKYKVRHTVSRLKGLLSQRYEIKVMI